MELSRYPSSIRLELHSNHKFSPGGIFLAFEKFVVLNLIVKGKYGLGEEKILWMGTKNTGFVV